MSEVTLNQADETQFQQHSLSLTKEILPEQRDPKISSESDSKRGPLLYNPPVNVE